MRFSQPRQMLPLTHHLHKHPLLEMRATFGTHGVGEVALNKALLRRAALLKR